MIFETGSISLNHVEKKGWILWVICQEWLYSLTHTFFKRVQFLESWKGKVEFFESHIQKGFNPFESYSTLWFFLQKKCSILWIIFEKRFKSQSHFSKKFNPLSHYWKKEVQFFWTSDIFQKGMQFILWVHIYIFRRQKEVQLCCVRIFTTGSISLSTCWQQKGSILWVVSAKKGSISLNHVEKKGWILVSHLVEKGSILWVTF